MFNKTYFIIAVVILAAITGGVFFAKQKSTMSTGCTADAKICPDGSAVGRVGSKCEFAPCPQISSLLSEIEARVIAERSCIKGGEALASGGTFNENSKTWWFDANLNATKPGCNPACVVDEKTKTAEINWRCTGAIPPVAEPAVINCLPEQRNVDACIESYQPVCATVEIQCIKAPCYPIQQTFSNSCNACKNSLVRSYVAGECQN